MVGLNYAKGLSLALDIPMIAVHHMEGHLFATSLDDATAEPPFTALLVSGGHTLLLDVPAWGRYKLLGSTRDDAAGEAFDKVAKLLGLPYPGGRHVEALARDGDPSRFRFSRPMLHRNTPSDDSSYFDVSFSGLKTAVLVQAKKLGDQLEARKADLAASTQAAIVEVLVKKSLAALRQTGLKRLVVAGGVGANRSLRLQLDAACLAVGVRVHYPELHLCTDNGAMIALAAAMRLQAGQQAASEAYAFDVKPRWPLNSLSRSL